MKLLNIYGMHKIVKGVNEAADILPIPGDIVSDVLTRAFAHGMEGKYYRPEKFLVRNTEAAMVFNREWNPDDGWLLGIKVYVYEEDGDGICEKDCAAKEVGGQEGSRLH